MWVQQDLNFEMYVSQVERSRNSSRNCWESNFQESDFLIQCWCSDFGFCIGVGVLIPGLKVIKHPEFSLCNAWDLQVPLSFVLLSPLRLFAIVFFLDFWNNQFLIESNVYDMFKNVDRNFICFSCYILSNWKWWQINLWTCLQSVSG